MALFDFFLKIEGIPGESLDDKHRDEIQLVGWSFGEENAATPNVTGGGGSGTVSMQDFHFTSHTSKASPLLFFACASGQHIPSAVLSVRKAGALARGGIDFLHYKIQEILVTSFSNAADGGGASAVPTDQFSLNFQKVEIDFTFRNAEGANQTISRGWDLQGNKKV